MGELGGEDRFCPVYEEEGCFARGPARGRSNRPQSRGELVNPLLAAFLESVESSRLESLEDLRICSLYLSVASGMSNRREAELDPDLIAVLVEGITGELRAVVGDDAVLDPEAADDSSDELYSCASSYLGDRNGFSPLGELVDDDVEELVAPDCSGEGPQDIQPPDREGP